MCRDNSFYFLNNSQQCRSQSSTSSAFTNSVSAMSCSIPTSILTSTSTILSNQCPRIRHILSGTFNTPNLHLLSYDTTTHQLSIQKSISAKGPHQFLALGQPRSDDSDRNETKRRRVYATTWALPPKISAWEIAGLGNSGENVEINFINEKEISE